MDTVTETGRESERTSFQALYEHEDFLRRKDFLSDEELTRQLVSILHQEKITVNHWLDTGDCFVLSSSGKVHLPLCPSMRQFVDRDAAWAPFFRDLEGVRDWHGSPNAPTMPRMLTRTEVEGLRTYQSCPVCAPTLDHTDKRRGARGWKTLKAGSLKGNHFGKSFCLVDGTEIGALAKISIVETVEGVDFRAEFDGLASPVTDSSAEVMYLTVPT